MEVLRSKLFSQYQQIVFGMSTRNGGVSAPPYDLNLSISVGDDPDNVRKNRDRFFGELNIDLSRIAFPLQVHSSNVQYVEKPGRYLRTDGLTTDVKELFIVITVADCLPVFLFDPKHNVIAGVHAGWKGSSQHITGEMVRFMTDRWNTNPSDIIAYLGPSAGNCCYEVGEEVANLFQADFVRYHHNGKYLLDIPGVNRAQLITAGGRNRNIEHKNECTICNSGRYHSYRRDGKKSGRMMGVMGMRVEF